MSIRSRVHEKMVSEILQKRKLQLVIVSKVSWWFMLSTVICDGDRCKCIMIGQSYAGHLVGSQWVVLNPCKIQYWFVSFWPLPASYICGKVGSNTAEADWLDGVRFSQVRDEYKRYLEDTHRLARIFLMRPPPKFCTLDSAATLKKKSIFLFLNSILKTCFSLKKEKRKKENNMFPCIP